ncbi:aminopeptidase [Ketobacter alkanivorans]|uniref:Aminopeptidase n=1 Tax=Ketobacter alkanivorans TaxID=1917421 RepID=A0A2K9LQJ1_9GAMM|nr:aminopeptidase [Ketobacter alkanivorans]AUM14598.1 hypothetical protein Kalk_20150 [Ketobacter alkanivorans]MCP5013932.1 aminopeptidase [Ketobacter sp.]
MWKHNKHLALFPLLCLLSTLSGCDLPYYWQAAHGQWDLIQRKQPIDQLLSSTHTPDATKEQLQYLLQARQFALQQLALEHNDSYLEYVDLQREYVSWNVFATPELSMQNHTWCYPIAGCVSYRGYFDEQDAQRYAEKMEQQGFDTYIGGVGAYSTLGWFDDPVLSTFLQRGKLALAALLFHELAHQVLYVQDDTVFNESFATSVETILLSQWIKQQGLQAAWPAYEQAHQRHQAFTHLILQHKARRDALYQSEISDQQKRIEKQKLIEAMRQDYTAFKQEWNDFKGYDDWFSAGLNNAQLSTVATYHQLTPGFLALYGESDQNIATFIAESRALAERSKQQRHDRLNHLASANIVYTDN